MAILLYARFLSEVLVLPIKGLTALKQLELF